MRPVEAAEEALLEGTSTCVGGFAVVVDGVVGVIVVRVLADGGGGGGGAVRALEKVGLLLVAPVVVRGVKETPVLLAFCCCRCRPCNSFSARQAS